MKRSHVFAAVLAVAVLCACAACGSKPEPAEPTPTPIPTPTPSLAPSATPEPAADPTTPLSEPGPLDGDDFPAMIEIPVTREGMTDHLTGTLRVSDMNYAIWLLSDYIFTPTADGDVIQPAGDSPLLPSITMKIARVDADAPMPEDYENDGLYVTYDRVTKDNVTFEVRMTYPLEAAEGGAAELRAMWETLRTGP